MKKYILFILVFILFPVYCFGSTVLYRQQESIFSDSANLVASTLGAEKRAIIQNESSFLAQIERETDLLYILSHGLPDEGIMITREKRIPWEKIAQHVQADILIVDTCFSGQIVEQKKWLKKPSVIIASTAKDNYSYNPSIVDDYRVSLLSVTMFLYFTDSDTLNSFGDWLNIGLHGYNDRMTIIFGGNYLLRSLKYLHLKLYASLIARESFVREIKIVEDQWGIPFKGFSSIQYEIGE